MKLSEIIKIAKREKMAIIVTDIDQQQWLNTGVAMYKLEGMPHLYADTFLNIAGVSEKQKEKWFAEERTDTAGIYKTDILNEIEITAELDNISIIYSGYNMVPFYLNDGVIWIEKKYFTPLENCNSGYLRFFVRGEKHRILAVKEGFVLIALIAECQISDEFADKLHTMLYQSRLQLDKMRVLQPED